MSLGDLLNLFGALGTVPVLIAARHLVSSVTHARRFLSFSRSGAVDVVVSTSGFSKSPGGTARSYKTNYGEVMAIAWVAKALGRYYRQKPLSIHMSERVAHTLHGDLVVLGGPLFNSCAADFLRGFNEMYAGSDVRIDAANGAIAVGTEFRVDDYDLRRVTGVPTRDLAVILVGRNPFAPKMGRGFLCAGLSTYGTAAAAEILFHTLLGRRQGRDVRRSLGRGDGLVIVVSATFTGQQCSHCQIEYVHPVAQASVAGRNSYP
ncbi:hypothetical protein EV382_1533 [Micromonospora violae]|uniref:Uncharacterized protein n=1 Tax=Micromonospora violae TaxID=1278207 RepID=A0A4V2FNU2_9ACTN|nr:hypothetical protein [Micromonospora violae]RZT78350.1 hypothetical protein EV382_1533 [Micromonospora violae]